MVYHRVPPAKTKSNVSSFFNDNFIGQSINNDFLNNFYFLFCIVCLKAGWLRYSNKCTPHVEANVEKH